MPRGHPTQASTEQRMKIRKVCGGCLAAAANLCLPCTRSGKQTHAAWALHAGRVTQVRVAHNKIRAHQCWRLIPRPVVCLLSQTGMECITEDSDGPGRTGVPKHAGPQHIIMSHGQRRLLPTRVLLSELPGGWHTHLQADARPAAPRGSHPSQQPDARLAKSHIASAPCHPRL